MIAVERPLWFRIGRDHVAGTLHRPAGSRKTPAVLLCHGFTGSKTESHWIFVKMARALVKSGIAAYRFDFRGSGESGGEFASMTIGREIGDARAALSLLARQDGIDPARLGVLGLSLGGCVGANLAARAVNVRSLALWSAVGDTSRWFAGARRRYLRMPWDPGTRRPRGPGGVFDLGGLALSSRFFTNATAVNPIAALRRCRRRFPVMVLHGTADASVPVSTADAYFDVLHRNGYPVRKVILAGVDHTYTRLDWESEVIRMTAGWFRRTLG